MAWSLSHSFRNTIPLAYYLKFPNIFSGEYSGIIIAWMIWTSAWWGLLSRTLSPHNAECPVTHLCSSKPLLYIDCRASLPWNLYHCWHNNTRNFSISSFTGGLCQNEGNQRPPGLVQLGSSTCHYSHAVLQQNLYQVGHRSSGCRYRQNNETKD